MFSRTALLAAGAAAIALAAPAAAQDYQRGDWSDTGTYDGTWQGEWESDEAYRGVWHGTYTDEYGDTVEALYRGVFIDDAHFVSDDGHNLMHDGGRWHERADRGDGYRGDRHHGDGHHGDGRHAGGERSYRDVRDLPASPDGRLAYTLTEREAWLADCRILMGGGRGGYASYDDRGRDGGDGPLVGGLLGAVVGGVVGNRSRDSDRLAGTLIGAGVGGLAGAALGALVDAVGGRDDDDYYYDEDYVDTDELYAARYCDAYLRRYEMGGGAGFMQAQPVMMVAAAPHGASGHRHGPECRTIVTEEWIEVEEAPPARREIAPRAPEPDKMTPL